MGIPIETVRGSHYEMGLAHGHAFRHVIHASVHNVMRHGFEEDTEEILEGLQRFRKADQTHAPWVSEELKGIAEGSGVEYAHLVCMHYRAWNYVPRLKKESCTAGCTAVGMLTEDAGVAVGGSLDDPRLVYGLIRRIPREGIPHVMVTWIGAAWGHDGMNAEGLAVAQASLGDWEPSVSDARLEEFMGSMLTRVTLETCRNVPEALAFLVKVRSCGSLVLGDSGGNLVACQCFPGMEPAVLDAGETGGMVFCTNHIYMKPVMDELARRGVRPVVPDHSRVRFDALEEVRSSLPRTSGTLQGLFRSHRGWPHSICRDATASAVVAFPQKEPGVLRVSDRPPCRCEFHPYPVSTGDV